MEKSTKSNQKKSKRSYQKPKLTVVGTVAEVTEVKGGKNQDGNGLPRSRSTGKPGS